MVSSVGSDRAVPTNSAKTFGSVIEDPKRSYNLVSIPLNPLLTESPIFNFK